MVSPTRNPAERERRAVIRAGLFVAIGLALAGVVVFVIGRERDLFTEGSLYKGAFENVDGLQLDSPVRLGGLQVGRVAKIGFATDLGDPRIVVTMEVGKKYRERIRKDSVARITGRGVLGDKAIDISLGNPQQPALDPGADIATGSSGDLSSVLKAMGELADNAVAISRDLRTGISAYTNEAMRDDVGALIHSARTIVGEVETGKGVLHSLLYDRALADSVRTLFSQAAVSAQRLDAAIARFDGILADVKTEGGSLHALIYDRKIAASLSEVGDAAHELASLIHDAKTTKDGAVYQVVYGDGRSLMGDLGQAAADVRALTGKVRAGEGSLGAIINDPTVYEDLKELLGNLKRNRVLRELVRLSISNADEVEKAGRVRRPPAAP
jgi:phospholipid/cholesterol/gamma-HCH transport system substrate-binding protein